MLESLDRLFGNADVCGQWQLARLNFVRNENSPENRDPLVFRAVLVCDQFLIKLADPLVVLICGVAADVDDRIVDFIQIG